MKKFERDFLPSPQDLIDEISREDNPQLIMSMLCRSYIVINMFPCDLYYSGKPWDTGFCLGYIIYAAPDDVLFLESCENILSSLAKNLAKKHYDIEDNRPFGIVMVLHCSHLLTSKFVHQIAFLESCYTKDSI